MGGGTTKAAGPAPGGAVSLTPKAEEAHVPPGGSGGKNSLGLAEAQPSGWCRASAGGVRPTPLGSSLLPQFKCSPQGKRLPDTPRIGLSPLPGTLWPSQVDIRGFLLGVPRVCAHLQYCPSLRSGLPSSPCLVGCDPILAIPVELSEGGEFQNRDVPDVS